MKILKSLAVLLLPLAIVTPGSAQNDNTGALNLAERQLMNFGWTFEDADGKEVTVSLPHDFQISQPWIAPEAGDNGDASNEAANIASRLSARGFKEQGEGTYTLRFVPSDALRNRRVIIDFEGIMLNGDAWLNGKHIGGTDYGYLGFEADVTSLLKFGEDNLLTVKASTGKPDNSRWYTGGGLYRNVSMRTSSPILHFNRHPLRITTTDITPENAKIAIEADINARKPLKQFAAVAKITNPQGEIVIRDTTYINIVSRWRSREYPLDTITVSTPQLWDCDSPNLYSLEIELIDDNGTVADRASSNFGFRNIEYSPEFGFKLNGKKTLLKGISTHHTLGALGAAAHRDEIRRYLATLKAHGFNEVRTAHNPFSEDFYDLCDQMGILVVDELYDKWLKQYAGGRQEWTRQWQQDLSEWARRDRNHPCIVMWSFGNELQGFNNLAYNDWGVTNYRLMKTLMERYDTARPYTVAMHPRYRSLETDSLPAPLVHETDIASYNFRYTYFPGDSRRFPNLIFFQSEANLPMMGPNFFDMDLDRVVGLSYWGMVDYLGESHSWPAKGWVDGVFDITLNPKPNAAMVQSMFSDEPVVKIGVKSSDGKIINWNGDPIGGDIFTASWNHTPGDTLQLYTYTNADEVALLLNGRELGRRINNRANSAERNKILWDSVIYAPGRLEAVAYTDGREVARDKLVTSGVPVRLSAETAPYSNADNSSWLADGMQLRIIAVEALDSKGRFVPDAAGQLEFSVEGPADIIATGNGDMTSDEISTDPRRSLYSGRAIVILRSRPDETGKVTLRVTSPGLRPATLSLQTVAPAASPTLFTVK